LYVTVLLAVLLFGGIKRKCPVTESYLQKIPVERRGKFPELPNLIDMDYMSMWNISLCGLYV
jgi:hypothetical protein